MWHTGEGNVSEDDFKKAIVAAMGDAARGLNEQVAEGKISAKDAQRVMDGWNAMNEMVIIATEMGSWACPPDEKMRREATLLAKWPEACRRAGIAAIPMPDDMMRAITLFVGRTS
jgi:hypothetical protein